jgi:hypothetical protein
MKESLLCLRQFSLRAAIIAAKNRSGSLQLFIQLFEAIGPRQWLAALAAPIVARARAIAFSARPTATAAGFIGGNAGARDFEQVAEETLNYEVSDEALEAASGMCLRIPTLANTYCFTCPTAADT